VWLIVNGICETAIATDISENCLARAEETARAYGVYDKISFIRSDGLAEVNLDAWDTLVVAGMGGETIISIIECLEGVNVGKTLILQPNTKQLELSLFLRERGFEITNEIIVRDRRRNYLIEVIAN
jgi:tRNA (adenine22-N1)-methyltransferase